LEAREGGGKNLQQKTEILKFMKPILREITNEQLKKRTAFKVGDGVKVHTKVREGDKERIQVFAGVVIALRGTGIQEMFTVRRIASGVGVERVFPVHSPSIEKIEVDREAVVGKARMYYLRTRIGKEATKVNEKRLLEVMGVQVIAPATEAEVTAKAEAKAAAKAQKTEKIAAKKVAKAEKTKVNAEKTATKAEKTSAKKE